MTNSAAITGLIDNIFSDPFNNDKDELLEALIGIITKHYEVPELLDAMADEMPTEDVYEACEAFVNATLTKIKNETIACAPIAQRIHEDCEMDALRDALEGRR